MKVLAGLVVFLAAGVGQVSGQQLQAVGEPELVAPGVVCTEASEVKVAVSPDGSRMLWGTVGWDGGAGAWDIWQSRRVEGVWQPAEPVSFNSEANDFDPAFAPDGSAVFFFSNRPGGSGGDDLYVVTVDPPTGRYGEPRNLGEGINTAGDEWGPTLSPDGSRLMYCSDGPEGLGKHDIFVSKREGDGWGAPVAVAGINSAVDDFDPTFLHDGTTIVFSRETETEGEVLLYVSLLGDDGYSSPVVLSETINTLGTWNFGAAIGVGEPGVLFFTSHMPDNAVGRADIYRVGYRLLTEAEGEKQ